MAAKKKKRRHFTPEYKGGGEDGAVPQERGKTAGESRVISADLTETSVRERGSGRQRSTRARARRARSRPRSARKLSALKREVKTLRLEREILKRRPSSLARRAREVRVHLDGEGLGKSGQCPLRGPGGHTAAGTTPGWHARSVRPRCRRSETRSGDRGHLQRPAARPTAARACTPSCSANGVDVSRKRRPHHGRAGAMEPKAAPKATTDSKHALPVADYRPRPRQFEVDAPDVAWVTEGHLRMDRRGGCISPRSWTCSPGALSATLKASASASIAPSWSSRPCASPWAPRARRQPAAPLRPGLAVRQR